MFPGQYYEKKQRARRKLKFTIILIVNICLLVLCALFFMQNKPDTTEVRTEVEPSPVVTDNNTTIELKKLYVCGHTKTEVTELPESFIGKTADEISLLNPEWHIIKLTNELLSVEEKIDTECDNHFLVKLKGNKIQAFKKNNKNNVFKELQISTSALTSEDVSILTAGIDVSSEYELLEVFESFSELN